MKAEIFAVCSDCYQLEGTGDSSFLDYYYAPKAAEARLEAIQAGYERLRADGGHLTTGHDIADFSRWPCECCGSYLHGSRHELIVLKEE